MDKKFLHIFLASLFVASLCLGFTACSKRYHNLPVFSAIPIGDAFNYSAGRFKTSYLADQIHAFYRGHNTGPIGIATFVSLDNLYSTSSFGRLYAEQLMSELSMLGYNVIELRQAEAMQIMFSEGEFGLSRETAVLRDWQDLSGIVVGTYLASPLRVYVNARLIDPKTSMVISTGSVEMDKSREIAMLLRNNSIPPTLERIPVRHLGYSSHPVPWYYQWPLSPPSVYGAIPGYNFEEEPFAPKTEEPPPISPLLPETGARQSPSSLGPTT